MKLKTIKQVKNLKGKRVLLRVDFNVPLKNEKVEDDFRIKAGLATIKYLLSRGASIIILSHLGRPAGKVVPELSNRPVSQRLSKLLNKKVVQLNEVVGSMVERVTGQLKPGQIIMLENVRFHPREEINCQRLAKTLASDVDLYVNDAFAVCHRQAASISAITKYLPSYAGLLLEKEVENLSKVLESRIQPKVAIIGGVKIETKVKVIKNLLNKMDYVLVGGAVANNVLMQMNYKVGLSLVNKTQLKITKSILYNKLKYPLDVVVAKSRKKNAESQIKAVGKIEKNDIILDIGPDTVELYSNYLKKSKLVVWNGPMGYFEISKYKKSSQEIAEAIAKSKAYSIVGGGETVELIKDLKLIKKFNFVSTGGGAMLEFLEGKVLPGIRPLLQ